jgi:hypothetical protein
LKAAQYHRKASLPACPTKSPGRDNFPEAAGPLRYWEKRPGYKGSRKLPAIILIFITVDLQQIEVA